jgi:hypothetical protein
MGKQNGLHLYLVTDGRVEPANPDTEWDEERLILVAATSEESALKIANAYHRGIALTSYVPWGSKTVYAVAMRDRYTGDYL